jgi:hypothetical protein
VCCDSCSGAACLSAADETIIDNYFICRYSQFIPTGSANTGAIRALRAVRALRPLRTITRFSSLRAIVVCFLEALPLLATLMVFMLFLFFLFALGGMLLFQDAFHHACVDDATGAVAQGPEEGSVRACGFKACPTGYTCQQSDSAYPSNAPGFDNIGLAMLTVFQVTTIRCAPTCAENSFKVDVLDLWAAAPCHQDQARFSD